MKWPECVLLQKSRSSQESLRRLREMSHPTNSCMNPCISSDISSTFRFNDSPCNISLVLLQVLSYPRSLSIKLLYIKVLRSIYLYSMWTNDFKDI